MSDRLAAAFADGPAFVPYLVAGDPTYEASLRYVEALDRAGADVIELGLPFSDPIAEGPTIQRATVRALEAGMTPERFLAFVADLDVEAPVVCMTYYNLIYRYEYGGSADRSEARSANASGGTASEEGPRPFVERAADVGVEGFVVPDLPAEEAGPLRAACDEFGLDLIFIVAPTTRGERLERIRERVSGYVYVQARLGTTGARDDVSTRTGASLDRLREWDVPRAVGFGVSTGDHAARIVSAGADGVIVGSALVDVVAGGYEADRPVAGTADRLESLARDLAAGAARGAREETPEPEQP